MTKPTKNKIGLALLACCLIAVCSCLGLTALANTQRYEFSFANGQTLLQEYTVGDVVTIPDGLFEGTTTLQATKKVVYPNGLTVTTNQITLSAVGKYKVVYQANVDDETITETKTFNVYYKKYEVNKASSSVEYVQDFALQDESISGVKVSLTQGATFNYNTVLDLSKMTQDDLLVKAYVIATNDGNKDAKNLVFRYTDLYDAENYFDVYVACDEEGVGTGMTYYRAGAFNQKPKGWDGYTNNNDITGQNGNRLCEDNIYGSWAGPLFWSSQDKLTSKQSIAFSLDYQSKRLFGQGFYPGKEVVDLDSQQIFGQNLWDGFTTGECKLSIFATSFTSTSLTFVITQINGVESQSFKDNLYIDGVAPNVVVDFQQYEETNLPNAVVGCPYPVFLATASDVYCNHVDVSTQVVCNKNGSNECSVAVVDSTFVPRRVGMYSIQYVAKDAFGFTTVKQVNVNCTSINKTLQMQLGEYQQTAHVGVSYNLPSFTFSGNQGKVKSTFTATYADGTVQQTDGVSFLPKQKGNCKITCELTDFAGQQVVKEYLVDVTYYDKPVFVDSVTMPKYFVGGLTNNLPNLVAYKFEETNKQIDTEIWITEGDNAPRKIEGNSFVPAISSQPYQLKVTYLATNNGFSQEAEYVVPCFSYVDDQGKIDKIKMFNVDDGLAQTYVQRGTRTSFASFIASTASDKKNVELLNPVYCNGLITELRIIDDKANFNALNVYLTDYYNANLQVKVSYIISGEKVFVCINDGMAYETSYGIGIDNLIDLRFDNYAQTIALEKGNSVFPVDSFLNGQPFDGFASGKVYVTYQMQDIYGESGVMICSLNGQNFTQSTSQNSLSPVEIVQNGVYSVKMQLNQTLQVFSANSMQVSSPEHIGYVTVYKPDGSIAVDTNGKSLNGVSSQIDYFVTLDSYGTYVIKYTVKDSAIELQRNVSVVDGIAPQANFTNKFESTYKVGKKITVSATATDNFDAKDDLSVYITVKTPQGLMDYVGVNSGEYTFKQAGQYVFRITVTDNYGNFSTKTFTVEVK